MPDKLSQAIKILKTLNQPDRVINRDRINFTKLMNILGNPYRDYKCIHITGTNGKGSVSIKTATILQKAGYTTGVYTSPHLFSFRQRIQVNGVKISQQQIANKIIEIDRISHQAKLPLSYFQFMTAAGFMHFKDTKCDYVALQVGLGGKNDTTNIIQRPQVSVITSIGLDHTDLLGPTKQHIAREKAGVIKKDRPVVFGPSAEGYQPIQQAIRVNNSKKYTVPSESYNHNDFQSENNAITLQVIKSLQDCDPNLKINENNIIQGLKARQLCRMELLKQQNLPKWAKDKKVYFDVGHNTQAINKVKQFIEKNGYKKQEVSFVFGTSRGKKFQESLAEIEKICSNIYLVEAKHFRACKIQDLQSYVGMSNHPNKYRCFADGDIKTTLSYVTMDPQCKVIVVSGSFFIMPEARGYFQPALIENPQQNINQIYQLNQQKSVN